MSHHVGLWKKRLFGKDLIESRDLRCRGWGKQDERFKRNQSAVCWSWSTQARWFVHVWCGERREKGKIPQSSEGSRIFMAAFRGPTSCEKAGLHRAACTVRFSARMLHDDGGHDAPLSPFANAASIDCSWLLPIAPDCSCREFSTPMNHSLLRSGSIFAADCSPRSSWSARSKNFFFFFSGLSLHGESVSDTELTSPS